jgi:hypothetical protein
MSKTANEILTVAKSWIGKNEVDGSFKYIIDLYNSHKPLARNYKVQYDDEWCATTISALSIHCGYTDIIPTECGCERMIDLFKKLGCWIEDESVTPEPGWIIFYDWGGSGNGWADHVGIVEKVANNTITTIEGNLNRAVSRNKIAVNSKSLRGFAVPKYDKEPVKPSKTVQELAQEVIDGKWGVGEDRKKKLTAAGYSYAEVQSKVNEMLAPKPAYYPKYTGKSIYVDKVLEEIGVPVKYRGSWARRKPIAIASGMKDDYRGTAAENNKIISLAKQGKLKKVQ